MSQKNYIRSYIGRPGEGSPLNQRGLLKRVGRAAREYLKKILKSKRGPNL